MNEAERAALIRQSPLGERYDKPVDRESAYEMLTARAAKASEASAAPAPKWSATGLAALPVR